MSIFERSKSSKKDKSNKKEVMEVDSNVVQNLQKKLNFTCEKKSEDIINILESYSKEYDKLIKIS